MRNLPVKQARTKIAMWLRQFDIFVFSTYKETYDVAHASCEAQSAKRFVKHLASNPYHRAFMFVREVSLSTKGRDVFTVYKNGRVYKLGWLTVQASAVPGRIDIHLEAEV